MTAHEWLAAYAQRLGVPAPSEEEIDQLLSVAGVAAHASERIAAPIACWLAAAAAVTPERALALARAVEGEDEGG